MKIDLVLRHEDFTPDHGKGRTAVVVDVLRATTSIVTALMNGSGPILPVATAGEAFELREKQRWLLAGERDGIMIEGFDFGNSPLEFTRERVEGRSLVFCTSNGTKSVLKASVADEVVAASFLNAASVVEHLKRSGRDAIILCAGTLGKPSLEDTVCGGMIVHRLNRRPSAAASEAKETYLEYRDNILACLRESFHGKHLINIGFEKDLEYAARTDITKVVPVLDEEGRLVLKPGPAG